MSTPRNHFGEIRHPTRFSLGEIVESGRQLATVIRRFGFDYEGRQLVRVVREDGEIVQGNVSKLPAYVGCVLA